MATYEERRDQRFHQTTIVILKDIEERGMQLPQEERGIAAYGILRAYVEAILPNFAAAFSEDQLAEIRIVLDQLSALVGDDAHLDDAKKRKLAQMAAALRESGDQA
jgi:hypothetical protein